MRNFIPLGVDHFEKIFDFNEEDYHILSLSSSKNSSKQVSSGITNRVTRIMEV